jgi:hypothetical protein
MIHKGCRNIYVPFMFVLHVDITGLNILKVNISTIKSVTAREQGININKLMEM